MKSYKIFNKLAVALGVTATLGMAACSDDKCPDYWGDHYGEFKFEEKPRFIWIDAAANSFYILNNREGITEYVTKAREAGFTDLLVDVRGTDGDVLFRTDRVQQASGFWQWKRIPDAMTSEYTYCPNEKQFDYLQAWIEEGHAQGVRVHAAMNTMVGANLTSRGDKQGLLYRDADKKDWATSIMVPDTEIIPGFTLNDGGIFNIMDARTFTSGEVFMNPHHPDVQNFIVGLVEDLATNYPALDGIILDRGRFLDCRSDFSDIARKKFEEYIGETLTNWPGDVFPDRTETVPTADFPKYYKQWWEFRAKTMHDLIERAAQKAHSVNGNIKFGCYVGAWYGSYYQNGVNWASPNFDPSANKSYKDWASETYKTTGYANVIDILILGCYAGPNNIYGSNDWTVQGFAANGMDRTMGDCPLVVGGPDLGSWPTANYNYVPSENAQPASFYHAALTNSVEACFNACDGYFLFDIIHLMNSPEYWNDVKTGISNYYTINGQEFPY